MPGEVTCAIGTYRESTQEPGKEGSPTPVSLWHPLLTKLSMVPAAKFSFIIA